VQATARGSCELRGVAVSTMRPADLTGLRVGTERMSSTSAGLRTLWASRCRARPRRALWYTLHAQVGPSMSADELVALVRTLNPTNRSGKITLISRLGGRASAQGHGAGVEDEAHTPCVCVR
jgi:hypothetical protein